MNKSKTCKYKRPWLVNKYSHPISEIYSCFGLEKDEIERVDKLEVDDVSKFDVTQVYSFEIPPERQDEAIYETMDDNDGSDSALFELDDRLIDYDMLTAEPEDADRIY